MEERIVYFLLWNYCWVISNYGLLLKFYEGWQRLHLGLTLSQWKRYLWFDRTYFQDCQGTLILMSCPCSYLQYSSQPGSISWWDWAFRYWERLYYVVAYPCQFTHYTLVDWFYEISWQGKVFFWFRTSYLLWFKTLPFS